ncbi:hypothetical protein Pyn_02164 [Prunus yedoensis var. nudiflora]|uniref:Uncharacterized protein n=1 Tax=Prunus yedoensis var. nudiflora TaxID=2094558 RepID=A0A314Z0Q9_PRUYE|nr:hypothetical protein Pyn_02164 [Prunus yedoensis var. nudiflora]
MSKSGLRVLRMLEKLLLDMSKALLRVDMRWEGGHWWCGSEVGVQASHHVEDGVPQIQCNENIFGEFRLDGAEIYRRGTNKDVKISLGGQLLG